MKRARFGCILLGAVLAAGEGVPPTNPVQFVRHTVLLQPSGADLQVRENMAIRNSGAQTFNRSAIRFYVPGSASVLRVSSSSPDDAPLQRTPMKTGAPGIYQIALPIRPGVTRLDVSYVLPLTIPAEFAGRTLQRDVPVRLITPFGVTLTGEGLTFLGRESKSQALNYSVAGMKYSVEIQTLSNPSSRNRAPADADSATSRILPGIYDNVYSILALAFAVLGLGFVRLYRMGGSIASDRATVASTAKSVAARTPRAAAA